ncbi:hypothetical protein AB4259_19495 [Vibrio amylolyticus]|uniref:hypothetical protein n=1 Tax=Vibrio amylolyticus TaxID=2847292 RepID=UPI0035527FA7
MAIFTVTAGSTANAGLVENAIRSAFDNNNIMQLGELTWLIDDENNTNAISVTEKLGVLNSEDAGKIGTYIVNQFNNYYGFHNSSVWDWLRAKGL